MAPMFATYVGLFAWSFAAATVLPLSSEVLLAYVVHTRQELALPVLIATAGNYLGGCTTYWIGRGVVRVLERRRQGPRGTTATQSRAISLIKRWGAPALLLSWVPILGDALVAAAGALRLPFAWSSVWLASGKLARYLAVAWAARAITH